MNGIWLWDQAQSRRVKRSNCKKLFLPGLAKGYCNKIHALKREYTPDVRNALMVIEKQLIDAKHGL